MLVADVISRADVIGTRRDNACPSESGPLLVLAALRTRYREYKTPATAL